jgi:diguanylate cyclase (GGDEF)-like protein
MYMTLKRLVLTDDPKQALRMVRHLMAFMAIIIFSIACLYFYYNDMLYKEGTDFSTLVAAFWAGMLLITLILRSGMNQQLKDPSMTMIQILWCTTFLLILIYMLNSMRGIGLIAYFAIVSFGFFRLNLREFIITASYVCIGYLLIIMYIRIDQPLRINLALELIQLVAFVMTNLVMVYTGAAVSKLRDGFRQRNLELADALKLNTRLATTDDLTGLYTRRYIMDMLSKQKAQSERDDSDFVILFADLDHFKQINDNYGHHTGDRVLKSFSTIIKSSIREIDYASRFGGEEFVVLLVKTDLEQAKQVAERIRSGIEGYNFADIAPGLNVTVSIGIANYKEYKSIQETLMTADNRMYRAKEEGRNKIIFE